MRYQYLFRINWIIRVIMGCMGNKGHQKVGFYGIERKGEYNVGSPNNRMYHNLGLIGVEIGC